MATFVSVFFSKFCKCFAPRNSQYIRKKKTFVGKVKLSLNGACSKCKTLQKIFSVTFVFKRNITTLKCHIFVNNNIKQVWITTWYSYTLSLVFAIFFPLEFAIWRFHNCDILLIICHFIKINLKENALDTDIMCLKILFNFLKC